MGLHGGAHVKWHETHTVSTGQTTTTYTVPIEAKESYVEQTTVVWSSEQSPSGTIGPGTYNFDFEFSLPETCLGSFEGAYGSIKYFVLGLIKTSALLRPDHKTELPIVVTRTTDTNLPHLMSAARQSNQKQVGFLCCAGNLELTASLTRTGFSVGQDLPVSVDVVNGSSRVVTIRTSVQRQERYYAQGRTRRKKEKLVMVVSQDIAAHSRQSFSVGDLIIPADLVPSFEGSTIMQMQYVLKVTALIPWAKNSSVSIPITLGNVPFNQ